MRWHRLDVPGREEARVQRTATGWRLNGELEVEEADVRAQLHYEIHCDPEWRTCSALIEGTASGVAIRFALEADGAGGWTRDGTPLPELAGALDVDLGFTPATNTLPIRRLGLAVGESASVRSAWLRFPELRLEPLEQTYTRETGQSFRYRALVDHEPFVARLDTDTFGRVLQYEGLWKAEVAEPSDGDAERPDATPSSGVRSAMTVFRGINVVSLSVPDLDRAREFYRDVLGLGAPVYDLPDAGWIEFATGGPGNLALTTAPRGWSPSEGTTVVLDTADCDAASAALRARGVRCDDPVVFPGYVTYCNFYDPFGNRLQMCGPAPAA